MGYNSQGIFFTKSTDGGASFSNSVNVDHNTAGIAITPRIAVFGNSVYVVWSENSTRNYGIFFKKDSK
jgi:hypothetical protein